MRKVFVYAVLTDLVIAGLLLYNQIKDFLASHPWYVSAIAALPEIAVPILAYLELRHSVEANELRAEANNHRIRANTLQEEQNKSVQRIAELQAENVKLQGERNDALSKIAVNTQRVPTEAEVNARILKRYLGKHAEITEKGNSWGGMGAIVAEVNENNILTLFCPAGYHTSHAYSQPVKCDKLHVVEVVKGACELKIDIIERYGGHTEWGEAKSWEERFLNPTHVGMQKGQNVFNAQYRKAGSPVLRHINIYAPIEGSSDYTMVTMEDNQEKDSWFSSKVDIEKKFAVLQVEWADAGYRHNGGSGTTLNLFFRK
jgi:hypothetical protein